MPFLSCVCYVFVRVCLYVLCGHLLGKGWPLGSRLWCLTVNLSHPGSAVVLDCIDSCSLHPYLLWYLNSKLDLNLSCAKDFQNLNSMVTWCINWRRLLALLFFQRSSFPIIKRLAITLMYKLQQTACLVVNPITVGNFAFLLHAGGADFRLYDGSNLKTYLLMRW